MDPDHYEKALASARRALEINPGDEEAMRLAGDALLYLGNHNEALKMLSAVSGVICFEPGVGVSIRRGETIAAH